MDDREPIVYPRSEVWRALSAGRQKYALTSLAEITPAEAKIRQALAASTNVEFIETPLNQAVDYLKDLHGIEIQLDTRALERAAMSSEEPVTAQMRGVSLQTALRLLLRPLDLTYVVDDDVLLITTVEVAEQRVVTRVYPVEDLVLPIAPLSGGGIGGPATGVGLGPGQGQSPSGSGFPGGGVPGLNGPGFGGPQGQGLGPF
jgi:hypothetical protein